MENNLLLTPIATIKTDFDEKFGIPRQSNIVNDLKGKIVFEPKYRSEDALRGLEGYSHIWLLWGFSKNEQKGEWSPTVRPPRLGGNTRMGVFATRSPNRPNPIGLSLVKISSIEESNKGIVINVLGADMVSGSPIYDIKPYLPYCESVPDASEGFTKDTKSACLEVDFPHNLLSKLPGDTADTVIKLLSQDPRPSYHQDSRTYGMSFGGYNIIFCVKGNTLHVAKINKI